MTKMDKLLDLNKELYSANMMMTFSNASLNRAGVAPTGYWRELGRSELGSAGDTITVSGLTTHRYYMILAYKLGDSGSPNMTIRPNNDSGSDYATRESDNGAEGTFTSSDAMLSVDKAVIDDGMFYGYLSNVANEEKLGIFHSISRNTAGAANVPNRLESVQKYVPSPEANITSITIQNENPGSSDFAIGSQCIVLGWEDTLTHGITDNFWQFLGEDELSSANQFIDTGTFATKEWLLVETYLKRQTASASDILTFNSDTSTSYALRRSFSGGSDSTAASASSLSGLMDPSTPVYTKFIIRNQTDEEKLGIGEQVRVGTAGAGNAPDRQEFVFKFDDATNPITTIEYDADTSNTFAAGSFIKVWGNT